MYDIKTLFDQICAVLKQAGIATEGIFLNADPGFDSKELRQLCSSKQIEANIKDNPRNNKDEATDGQYFDEELYKRRVVIEHANAWLDSFKALLVRFETTTNNWMALHWMAFTVCFLRKINKQIKG